jgi:hypothetical protein
MPKTAENLSCTSVTVASPEHSDDTPNLPERLQTFSRNLRLSFTGRRNQRVCGDKTKSRSTSNCELKRFSRSMSPAENYPSSKSVNATITSKLSMSRSWAMKKALSETELTDSSTNPCIRIVADHNGGIRFESLSSLEYILNNWIGLDYLLQYGIDEYMIEPIVFWLDVEHFKHFDGNQDDLAVYAANIVAKYIVDGADLAVCLPGRIRHQVLLKLDNPTHDMFNKAQNYMFAIIERDVLDDFLKSEYGHQYLKALVDQDNKRKLAQSSERLVKEQIEAHISNFDKRRNDSKYYVYQVDVKFGQRSMVVYRRYSDFFELNQALQSEFPSLSFPPLPKKILFGRSQVQSVASKRMVELNAYLQKLLSMGPEVTNSHTLLLFLRQTEEDIADEAFNRKLSVKGAGRLHLNLN